MRFLTQQQGDAWLDACSRDARAKDRRRPPGGRASIESSSAAKLYSVARSIHRWTLTADTDELLVLVTEHGVWPSSEHLFLYQLIRLRHNDAGTVDQTPGHAAVPAEAEDLVAVMFLALMYGWGFVAAARGSPRTAHVDHDGVIWLVDADAPTAVDERAVLGI